MGGLPRKVISTNPIVTAGLYAAGQCVGGIQTLVQASRGAETAVCLDSITVIDRGNQKAPLTLLFFQQNPAAATATDNAAFAFSTDVANLIGKIDVAAGDYETVNGVAVACDRGLKLDLTPVGTALYVVAVTTGTPTYTAPSNLTFLYGMEQS